MRIAIDAMGGDRAPLEILHGALLAMDLLAPVDELILVGNPEVIKATLGEALTQHKNMRIEPALQVVTMDDSPVDAVRHKRDSSLVKMVKLAANGGADAIISAGNTGALVAAGVLLLKPLPGVERPGIAVTIPTPTGVVMLCDAGANSQPKPAHLYQYAVMASLYIQHVFGIANPRVGILNIGTEDEKGTPLIKDARPLLAADPALNFIGSIEPRGIFRHNVDVVVTDGFTGNISLKLIESCSESLIGSIQREIAAEAPQLAEQFKPAMARVWKRFDHEEYGGALLLGVAGSFLKVHGSGGRRAIRNAVAAAQKASATNINQKISDRLGPAAGA
jgi:glycerol-3-phosphate acyltransferase PlsX